MRSRGCTSHTTSVLGIAWVTGYGQMIVTNHNRLGIYIALNRDVTILFKFDFTLVGIHTGGPEDGSNLNEGWGTTLLCVPNARDPALFS